MHLSHDFKDLDVKLYIEVVDGIGGNQRDLMSENLVVKKQFEKLCDEEATLKNLFFFLDSLSATVCRTEGRYSPVITYCDRR